MKRWPSQPRGSLRSTLPRRIECSHDRVPGYLVPEALQSASVRVQRQDGFSLAMRTTSATMSGWSTGDRDLGCGNRRISGRRVSGTSAESGRCHDTGHVCQAAPAEDAAFHAKAAALVVGEARPSGSVRRTADPGLLEQVVNGRLLLPVHQPETSRSRKAIGRGSESIAGACRSGATRSRCAG